ncbi:MAG: thioesterase family protein [Bdellovibrionales bacterium]|nr:thioesterase family protein [Bdellovibrionales bacterium]
MARIEIELPEKIQFKTVIKLRVGDMNYGGHLGNEAILLLAQESRRQFFNFHQLSEISFAGSSVIQTDAAIVYQSQAYAGEEIEIRLSLVFTSKVAFEIYYQLFNLTQNKDLAKVKTGMCCFDYKSNKIQEIPAEVLKKLTI